MITAKINLSAFMHSVVERHLACLAQTTPPKLPRRSIKRRLVHMKKEDPGGQPMSHLLPYNQKEGKKRVPTPLGCRPPRLLRRGAFQNLARQRPTSPANADAATLPPLMCPAPARREVCPSDGRAVQQDELEAVTGAFAGYLDAYSRLSLSLFGRWALPLPLPSLLLSTFTQPL